MEKKNDTLQSQGELKRKLGLGAALAVAVGTTVGSGIFSSLAEVAGASGSAMMMIASFIIGGLIMIICAYMFTILATRYAHVNGLVDYAEALMGKRYAYYMGWFTTFIYFPAMTSVLAWVSARYLGVLCGFDITSLPWR